MIASAAVAKMTAKAIARIHPSEIRSLSWLIVTSLPILFVHLE